MLDRETAERRCTLLPETNRSQSFNEDNQNGGVLIKAIILLGLAAGIILGVTVAFAEPTAASVSVQTQNPIVLQADYRRSGHPVTDLDKALNLPSGTFSRSLNGISARQWADLNDGSPIVSRFSVGAYGNTPVPGADGLALANGNGVDMIVANHSDQPRSLTTLVMMPRGIYTIEALKFISSKNGRCGIQRLEGVILNSAGPITKRLTLAPKQIAIYRYRNELTSVLARQQSFAISARRLFISYPYRSSPLHLPVIECSGVISAVAGSVTPDRRSGLIREIHHGLLLTGQIEAEATNLKSAIPIKSPSLDLFKRDVHRLVATLSQMSADCAELTIDARIHQLPNTAASVTIEASNGGPIPLRALKIAMSVPISSSSGGGRAVVFPVVNPGQVARAEFNLSSSSEVTLPIYADLWYFSNWGPAHLRLVAL